MLHILDRSAIHFFSSAGVVMVCFFLLRWTQRRKRWPWLPAEFRAQLVLVAVCIVAGTSMREAWDVGHGGQSVVKAFCDYASWIAGCGISAWGLWRVRSM